ncbi:MAG TPA: GNAT family N-acetyltransferase [Vicinamibacterales bacterium]|nr:GNAT family N-acetyltransferase [Vicinamibacterales bacterium]
MPPDQLSIALAGPSDAAAVQACVDAAYTVRIPRIGRTPSPMLADYPSLIALQAVHVVREGDEVAAVLVLRPSDGYLLIENVAVRPAYQRRGFGSRLLSFAEERARALGLPELRLYTHLLMVENQRLYRARGYVETGRVTEHGFARVYMVKRL